MVQTVAYVNRK